MQKLVRDYLDELKKQRKKHRRARIAVMLLIVLVAGTVTGGLTRNGITMTEDARCGLVEHVHTDECYQEVLICGYGGLQQEEGGTSDSVQDASASESLQEDSVPAPEEEAEEFLPEASAKQAAGHHHTDDCYELRDVLLCKQGESEGHKHTDDCYEIKTSQECVKEESEGHTHTDACYETETKDVPVCELEEDEEHEHTDDCYESRITTTMICGEKESEGHTHTEECEVSERVLVCGEEEYAGHEHTDDCYGQEEVLICGQEEREEPVYSESPERDLSSDAQDEKTEQAGDITQEAEAEQHIHTEDCYELQPVCGIPEHTHSEECQIDTSADVEDESEWDAQYADVEWTDAWGADLVTAAQMQLGYRESEDNYRIAADGSHKGYNRYGAFAGDAYVDWDAAFVNFCMYYAGLTDADIFPQELDAGDWYDAFVEADENNIGYLTVPDGYEPEAGDLVFFEREKEEEREEEPERMMGIVSSYDEEENTVTVIEGNSDNEVRENTYDIDDEQISAYLMITALEESVKTDEPVTDGTGLVFTTEDVEDASDWDAQYADVEWTDAWGADLVTAAQMQIGYRESEDDYEVAEDGSLKGYTRYGAFAGDKYADWDAAFVNFCMYYAGLADTDLFPQELDAGDWYDAFAEADEQNMEYLTAPEGYEPEAGDLVFFERETEEGEPEKEMGIVSSYDAEQNEITVIEGDSDDEVRENTYDADDEQIGSYLMITALEESAKVRILTAEGEDYIIEVRFTEEAGIPEDAILDVREITEDSDEYWEYYEQSLEAMDVDILTFARYFDISFLVDGEEIEPLTSVNVTITYTDDIIAEEGSKAGAVHFTRDGDVEVLDVESNVKLNAKEDASVISEEGAEEDSDTGNTADGDVEENPDTDTAAEDAQKDSKGNFFRFDQNSFSTTGTVLGTEWEVSTLALDDDEVKYTFTKFNINSLDDLDGNDFLITNLIDKVISKKDYHSGIMGASEDGTFIFDGRNCGLQNGELTTDKNDQMTRSAGYAWRFEKVKESENEFYIYNVKIKKYLTIKPTTDKAGEICFVDEDKKEGVTVTYEGVGDYNGGVGTISISKNKYYLDNSGRGKDSDDHRKFIAFTNTGTLAENDRITLYKLDPIVVVLNPCNIKADGALNSGYHFWLDKEQNVFKRFEESVSQIDVILPSNDTRTEFSITKNGEEHYIEDDLDAYMWRLKGWYNIADDIYYSVKDGPRTVTLDPSKNNVFYADWVAESYNNGLKKEELGGVIPNALGEEKTRDFIHTQLFDYSELVNITLHEADKRIGVTLIQKLGYNKKFEEEWTTEKKLDEGQTGFLFADVDGFRYKKGNADDKDGALGTALKWYSATNERRITDEKVLSTIANTLFPQNTESDIMGVQYVGDAYGLYQLDDDNYYVYDSNENAASYNKQDKRFYVYKGTQTIGDSKSFLPLNGEGKEYANNAGQINYWFGMKNEIDYWLNDDSGSGEVNYNYKDNNDTTTGKPMVFEFVGDDDLWVYDQYTDTNGNPVERLVLNLTGTHGKWSGAIDFSSGRVIWKNKEWDKNELKEIESGELTDEELKNNGNTVESFPFMSGKHKLTIYYLERGANLSNCKIKFNLVPTWEYIGTPVQEVTVTKEWDGLVNENEVSNESVTVGLYEGITEETAKKAEEQPDAELDAKPKADTPAWTYTWKYLKKDGNFFVKETDSDRYQMYGAIKDSRGSINCWIEDSRLEKGERIVISNGKGGNEGFVLMNVPGDNSIWLDTKAIGVEYNDILKIGSAEYAGISEDMQWIVHIVKESAQGHMQFRLESVRVNDDGSSEGSGMYLNIDGSKPRLVSGDSEDEAPSTLYFSSTGMICSISGNQLVFDTNNSERMFEVLSRTNGKKNPNEIRVHLYKYFPEGIKTTNYTITNTLRRVGLQFQKVDKFNETILLPGAEFTLYNVDTNVEYTLNDENGLISAGDVPLGTYKLEETKAPAGYSLLEHPIMITITSIGEDAKAQVNADFKIVNWEDGSATEGDKNNDNGHVKYIVADDGTGTFVIKVPNMEVYELPSTGGIGIYWYMISGVLLMMTTLLITYRTKLKTEQKS